MTSWENTVWLLSWVLWEVGGWLKDGSNPRSILQGINPTQITAGIENKQILQSFFGTGHIAWFSVCAHFLATYLRKSCTPWAATSQADHHHSNILYIGYESSVKLPVQSRDDNWIGNDLKADSLYFVPWMIGFTCITFSYAAVEGIWDLCILPSRSELS